MTRTVSQAVQKVAETITSWEGVDAIALTNGEDDVYDPYFFLSIDVYYRGEIPDSEKRRQLFSFGSAFEASAVNRKDRFLMGDLPVRLEYKDMARFEELVRGAVDSTSVLRDSGTYMFYRLQNSQIIHKKSDWIDQVREDIAHLRDDFWTELRHSVQSRMEHFVSDLGAAVIQGDELFYLVSLAGFARSLCNVLFAVNRQFEPSSRYLAEQTLKLPVLPESFKGRFEAFLRSGSSLSREKMFELAELLARSVLSL